jgi:hypothetical protein
MCEGWGFLFGEVPEWQVSWGWWVSSIQSVLSGHASIRECSLFESLNGCAWE